MRLKVEIKWHGEPWKKRIEVQRLAFVDATFGVILSTLYIVKLGFPDLKPEFVAPTPNDRWNYNLALVFLMAANLIQTAHASRLCYFVSRNEGRTPVNCHQTAKTWFDFTEFSYLFMIVKCLATIGYIFKVAPHPWILILAAITLTECIFKLYILYVVYDFMRDIRKSLKYIPTFSFVPIQRDSSDCLKQNNNNIMLKDNGDINSNTQFLV